MSAIAGIYYLNHRPVERADLGKMIDILAHRGPDGANIWSEGSIGLGHRMLYTTPESLLENLPLVRSSGELVITADARIDNRDELIAALDISDRPAEKITDSELILAAYQKWGESCPEQLLGDFAFAIWDGTKQVLFCARDHFGVKPFYYYLSEQAFIFATEIKAIVGIPEVPRRINEVKVGDYLTSVFDDTATTFYQGILRLPPAHSMTVSSTGTRLQSYWSLDPMRELKLGDDEEYAQEFRKIFTEAVRCRLRSAFPVGSLLSGGLDSSSVTCVARNLLNQDKTQPLPTFSMIFDEVSECDERRFINTVLAGGNIEPHYIHGDHYTPLTDIDQIFWHEDEVFYAAGLSTTWKLCDAANQQGVRILLQGHDGDGTVSHGLGYLQELARMGRWFTLAQELRGLSKTFNQSYWELLWGYVQQYGLEPILSKSKLFKRIWRGVWRRIRLLSDRPARPAWNANLNPEFIERIDLAQRYQSKQQAESSIQTERQDHYQTLTGGMQPFALEVLDKAAAAFAIEPRYPFWDKRLVEFCLSLPANQKLHQGWSRMVMRRAMTDILPVEIQWRRDKSNFFPNFSKKLLLACEQQHLDEVILNNSELIEKYVDINAFREAYHRFVSGDRAMPAYVYAIWRFVSLALWLQYTTLTSSNQ